MKNCIFLLLFVAFATILAAQAPQAINYQAIARNSAGNPVVNQAISVRFSILQGSTSGTVVYMETFTPTHPARRID